MAALRAFGLLAFFAVPVSAQTRIGIRAGASDMSMLAHDSIVQAFSVKPDIAPTIGFWVETRIDTTHRLSIGLSTAWSRLARHENGATSEVVTLNTWTPHLALSQSLSRSISVFGRTGAILYRADRTASNLFRDGSSPMPFLGMGGTFDHELSNGMRLTIELGYDVHRFSTPSLRAAGFSGDRAVHRLGLSIGVSRAM